MRIIPFNLFDGTSVMLEVGLEREQILWIPQSNDSVVDHWSAARYCIDLLRSRLELRQRFPKALSGGLDSPFLF